MWSLYQNKKFLEPLSFSNGKTQESVVKEIIGNIKNGQKVIFIKGVCGTGKCLEKNSLIFCKPLGEDYFSYHKISDLVGKKGKIMSLNKEGKIAESTFFNVRNTGEKKLYRLKTRTGREIIVSQNHPFLTITGNGISWKPLRELDGSSYICLPSKISPEKELDYDENKIKVLAHLIAEGKLGDKAGSPKYYQSKIQNPIVRADYINSLKKLFPKGEIKESQTYEITIVFRDMDTTKGTTNKLRLFVREHGLDGIKSSEKFVPKIIFNLKKDKMALFLSRLFSCDGSIYSRSKSNQIVVEYSSISQRLIQDVSVLLSKFGIHHTITSKRFRDKQNYSWRICISNHEHIRKYIEQIGFIGRKQKLALDLLKKIKDHKFTNIDKVPRVIRGYLKNKGYNYYQLNRFLNYEEIEKLRKNKSFKQINKDKSIKTPFVFNQNKIDFLRVHLRTINRYIQDKTLSFICGEDILWDKVKIIKFIKEDDTYDLEVPKDHNFISNGIIIHNSAIALHLAKELGKTSIVVPGKNLQNQYKKDYEGEKYVTKDNDEKLKIKVITGRGNHKCTFLEENKNAIPTFKKEVNSKLHDIFAGKREEAIKEISQDASADNYFLPCKIEIKEKNWDKIKRYITENKAINYKDFKEIKDVRRPSVAGACPYWSPVLPSKYEYKGPLFSNAKTRKYMGLKGIEFTFYQRKEGCPFYDQFNSYIDSDVIIFNSAKYKLETMMNRKPLTEVEVIDECDEFLDSFANQKSINLDRLLNSLIHVISPSEEADKIVHELMAILEHIKKDKKINEAVFSQEIIPLKKTGFYDLLQILLNSPELFEGIDEESYIFEVEETARAFQDFMEETYLTLNKKENNLIASLVTTNLAKKFKELIDKNKTIVLMSGTIHSESVLKNIFGLNDFKTIEAEVENQGRIHIKLTGKEKDCKYSNFSNGKIKRGEYLDALNECVKIAKKPALVHINAFSDLPTEEEIREFNLKYLLSRNDIKDTQNEENGEDVHRFKKGESDILFSTRVSRGIDFPGDECRSIIFTKYPNPNVQDAFWKILAQTKPQHYWDFYRDKAKRELWQKIYRGLRFKEDEVDVLSPDIRVLNEFSAI
ncbi:MAG: hypothetical protein KKB31_02465 [Nanoarchaeota archaeon]|nr:hypothetical protein [Nanoarchaeota archaeon]